MDTQKRETAHSILEETKAAIEGSFDLAKIFADIEAFVAYLQHSEKLLINAIEHAQGQPLQYPEPESGEAEFGWLPYLFEHAKDPDSTDPLILAFQAKLSEYTGKYAHLLESVLEVIGILATPQISSAQWLYLEDNMDQSKIIANDGTIVGDSLYEDLDSGWLYVPLNYIVNLAFPSDIASFTPPGGAKPFNQSIGGSATSIKVAIIGDWGTGDYEASPGYKPSAGVLQAVENLDPDFVIHLGDVYYCGTDLRLPPGEEASNFLDLWPNRFAGKSFTLNSNHEMYGGAQGFFNVALNRVDTNLSPFSLQNGYSYFACEFGEWVIVGMDAAYNDTSALYMQGGIGTDTTIPNDPQLEFLRDVAKQYKDKKIILMSHQTGMSTDGTTTDDFPLFNQTQALGLTPDYWYWGHIHLGLVYGDKSIVSTSTQGKTKARCVGHSAIPFGDPWGLKVGGGVIDFIADTPVPDTSLIENGLAMLTLGSQGEIKEQFFNGVEPGSTDMPVCIWHGPESD